MNIQYQRNLKNSYMVVIEPGQPLNMDGQLAEKMIQRQRIPGLLSWVTMENEGDMTFWYRITGLQSLSDWLSHHTLDYKLFGHLLSGLLALQEELPRFYLKTEHLLLQTEQIFLDTSGEQVAFCYEPMWSKEPRQALGELMEQLLPKIDHGDKDAVRLGYGLYEKCQEENADIWHYVLEHHAGNGCAYEEQNKDAGVSKYMEKQHKEKEYIEAEHAEKEHIEKEYVKKEHVEKGHLEKNRTGKDQTGKEHRTSYFEPSDNIWKKYVEMPEKMAEKLPVISALSWVQNFGKKKKKKPEPIYLFEPEETEAESENPTVYLGAKETAEGRLLYCGAGGEENFMIDGDVFLLGGRNAHADGQLQASGISRSHARITREDNEYYIEDLNSRNGTYVNGELLPYKQKCKIKPGDHLRFAREEYVFY